MNRFIVVSLFAAMTLRVVGRAVVRRLFAARLRLAAANRIIKALEGILGLALRTVRDLGSTTIVREHNKSKIVGLMVFHPSQSQLIRVQDKEIIKTKQHRFALLWRQ